MQPSQNIHAIFLTILRANGLFGGFILTFRTFFDVATTAWLIVNSQYFFFVK